MLSFGATRHDIQHSSFSRTTAASLPKFHQFRASHSECKCRNPCSRHKSWVSSRAMATTLPLGFPPPRHCWQGRGHDFQAVRQALVKSKLKLVLDPVPVSVSSSRCRHYSRLWKFQADFTARCFASSSASGDAAPSDIPSLPESSSNESVNTSRWKPQIVRLAIGVAVVVAGLAVSSLLLRRNHLLGSHPRELIADLGTSDASSREAAQFTVKWFGRRISLSEKSPGYLYFLLLMAAGFGLFVSEEALNVWVGGTLGRLLIWNQSRDTFVSSISENLPYIASTVTWVYWGVCISDMVPFYAGRHAAKSGTGNLIRENLGVSQEKFDRVRANVQRYGNLIGIVERFSLGIRNPTSFLAGFVGIKATNYFAGVCVGGLITLPIQIGVGLFLRDRPVAALAGVATVVGIWTLLPYTAAGIGSIMFFARQNGRKRSS